MKLKFSIINKRQVITLLVILSSIIVIAGYLYYNHEMNVIRLSKYYDLKAIADLKENQIVEWIKQRKADAVVTSQSPLFVEGVENWIVNKDDIKTKQNLIKRLSLSIQELGNDNVFLTSTNGQIYFSTDTTIKNLDQIALAKISESADKRENVFTDFYFSKYENKIVYDIITPLINERNNVIAILVFRRDPNKFLYPLIQNWPTPSESSETSILRIENDSVVYLNELRHRKNTALKLKMPLIRTDIAEVQAALGRTGMFECKDYRGVSVLSDIRVIPEINWIMLAKVDESEIYSSLYLTAGIIMGFSFLLILTFGLILVYIYNSQQKDIFKELYNKEKELWQHQERFKVTMDSLGDGVITLDLNGKVQYMNNLAEELTGWNLRDARGRHLVEVYPVKNEETGEKENNILEKVIKHGIVKELANHTILISKSGKEIPVMDTGAPVYDSNGSLIGIVIAFQDETVKRIQQKQLRESEEELKEIFEYSPVGISLTEVGGTLKANTAFCNILGYTESELQNINWKEITHPDDILESDQIVKAMLDGKQNTAHYEKRYIHKTGKIVWSEVHTTLLRNPEGKPYCFITAIADITQRKLAQEKIIENEKQLSALLYAVGDAIVVVSLPERKIVQINKAFTDIFGYSEEEVIGKKTDILYPTQESFLEYGAKVSEAIENNNRSVKTEMILVKKNGTQIICDFNNSLINKNGSYYLTISVIRDITEKVRIEQIRKSHLHLIQFAENHSLNEILEETLNKAEALTKSRIGFFHFVNEDQKSLTLQNWSTKTKTEYCKAEGKGMHYPIDHAGVWVDCVRQLKPVVHNDYMSLPGRKGLPPDHAELVRELVVPVIRSAKIKAILGVGNKPIDYDEKDVDTIIQLADLIWDISERKQAEEAIRIAKEEWEKTFDAVPDATLIIDLHNRITRFNPALKKLIGIDTNDLIERKCYELVHGTNEPPLQCPHAQLLKDGKEHIAEFHEDYLGKDLVVSASPLHDTNSQLVGVVHVARDITERKQAERDRIAREAAETANRTKSEFLANMSHEIRTPMNAVLGYTELLDSTVVDQTQKDYINSIKSSGRSLLTLIDDILDLSKIEAGKLEFEFDYVDTNFFFSEFEKIFSLKTTEKGLKFILDITSGTPPGIYIDEARVRQIVFNLIGNAIKFTNEGSITLKVYTENPRVATYRKDKSEELIDLVIEVSDTGIGISKGLQDLIFEPFVQEKGRKHPGGTGLGLAISRKLSDLMNGSITVRSKPGKGSTFTVKIPEVAYLKDFSGTIVDVHINPSDIIFEPAVILIADDVEHNRSFLRDALKNTNLKIFEAEDGFTALSLAKQVMPNLVIADIRMPNMDGFQLLNKIKSDKKLKNIPVIAYSASVLKAQKDRIYNSEFKGLLIKPVRVTELYLELMNILPYKSVQEVSPEIPGVAVDLIAEIADLPGLINSLETEFYIKWQAFTVRQPIREIRDFGIDLEQLGKEHNSGVITGYGKELIRAADSFNIEAILKLIGKYRGIIENLKGSKK